MFVADPVSAPRTDRIDYARPDDPADGGGSWRARLFTYNETPAQNPYGLLPAWQLYDRVEYGMLVERFGIDRLFVLSAGWGLIPGSFLTPAYDITFSSSAERYKRRRETDRFHDFNFLPKESKERLVFLGGKDYVPLFCRLTEGFGRLRVVVYNSATPPSAPGCELERYNTTTRTNWHYEGARALIRGELIVH